MDAALILAYQFPTTMGETGKAINLSKINALLVQVNSVLLTSRNFI